MAKSAAFSRAQADPGFAVEGAALSCFSKVPIGHHKVECLPSFSDPRYGCSPMLIGENRRFASVSVRKPARNPQKKKFRNVCNFTSHQPAAVRRRSAARLLEVVL
jgi:hypothetical protein